MHVSGNRSHGCIWSALLIKITGFTTSPSPMTQSCNHPCESFPTSAISCRWAFATKSPSRDSNAYVIDDCNSCNRKFGEKRPLQTQTIWSYSRSSKKHWHILACEILIDIPDMISTTSWDIQQNVTILVIKPLLQSSDEPTKFRNFKDWPNTQIFWHFWFNAERGPHLLLVISYVVPHLHVLKYYKCA